MEWIKHAGPEPCEVAFPPVAKFVQVKKRRKQVWLQYKRNSLDPADFRTAKSDNRDPLGVIPRQAVLINTLLTCSIERGDIRSMQNYVYNEPRHILNGIL